MFSCILGFQRYGVCGLMCFVSWNSGCFILLTASWHLVANPETSQTAAAVCDSCSCRYNVLFKRFLCFTVRNYLLVKWYSSMMLRDSRVSAKLCTYTHYKGNPNPHKCKMSLRLVGTSATTSVWLCRALSVCFIENISVHSQTGEALALSFMEPVGLYDSRTDRNKVLKLISEQCAIALTNIQDFRIVVS